MDVLRITQSSVVPTRVVMSTRSGSKLRPSMRNWPPPADPPMPIPIIVISSKDLTPEESARLRDSVALVMRKQGLDTGRLIEEINGVVKVSH